MNDRELDAFLAEHLFGWEREQDGCLVVADGPSKGYRFYPGEEIDPAYSSTGDGMLQVLEKMRERGFKGSVVWDRLDQRSPTHITADWSVTFDGAAGALNDSLPRAVAAAAFTALGGVPHHV